ncbi:MAG: PIN domain-containing protein [Thaumarchaeota archaeon]|nr:PIN domain-containing protein [Nitrososphaerota archaeon]
MIDTNIIAYAHDVNSPNHQVAAALLEKALGQKFEAVISIQNISELYSVLTNSRKLKNPLSPQEASRICKLYLSSAEIPKIAPNERAILRALELASELNRKGGDFFDCVLAATMESEDVKKILTKNVSDFKEFKFVSAASPITEHESRDSIAKGRDTHKEAYR